MFSPKKLIKMASIGRKRIPSTSHSPLVAEKGHFAVYTVDHGCFVIPLSYLHNQIFQELFRMSEEEFGLSSKGPITLPCDAAFMGYVVSLIQGGVGEELEFGLSSKGPITLPCDAAFMGAKNLLKVAGKWQKIVPGAYRQSRGTRSVANKGHFVVYTIDQRRFMVPLSYLYSNLFQELLRMSEEEFGLSGNNLITLPCDAASTEYVISNISQGTAMDIEMIMLSHAT
ncbi:hypothetical protein CDL15_Pgr019751 [Punica granatum]|uniref:Auxin-responsive protein SAUR68-like n=1 Tax=Punica granatum TaxID=22663 RepID=A0A218X7I9_PUNGR|nr:hypothetical protein CDL15_Pgr019751 [Punica granatum]